MRNQRACYSTGTKVLGKKAESKIILGCVGIYYHFATATLHNFWSNIGNSVKKKICFCTEYC